jgi:malate dehydrogenase (oxaloacetate-decarboxylating)(NADP+)
MMRIVLNKAKTDPRRVALAEGTNTTTIRAAARMREEGIAHPLLIGDRATVESRVADLGLDFDPEVVDPEEIDLDEYADALYRARQRKGLTRDEAADRVRTDADYLGSVMVERGDADALLTGLTHHYPSALRPPLQVIGTAPDAGYAAGVYMLAFRNRVVFVADTTVNQDPGAAELAEIGRHTADLARRFNVEPRVAFLSYSNFGSVDNEGTRKPRRAAESLRAKRILTSRSTARCRPTLPWSRRFCRAPTGSATWTSRRTSSCS